MSIVGIVSVIIIGAVVCISSIKANANTVKLLILLCFFQNIYILVLSRFLTSLDYTIICFMKEILVYMTIIVSFLRKRKIDKTERYSIIAIIVLLGYIIIKMDFSMGVIASFRQLSIPFIFYIFGRSVKIKKGDFLELVHFFVTLSVFSVLFGMIQIIVGPALYDSLGMRYYMKIKYGFLQMNDGYYIPVSMLSWDLYKYTGKVYLRLSSILVDPVVLSQILALAFALVTFDYSEDLMSKKRKRIYSILLLSGVVLTLGKGGIIITALVFVYFFGKRNKERKLLSYAVYLVIGFICIILIQKADSGESISLHWAGLVDNIQVMKENPLGTGIGTAGNMAAKYAESTTNENSGESFIGAVIGQMGIIGIIIYFLFIYGLFVKYKRVKQYNNLYNIIFITTNCMWITSFLNNTAISFTNCFMYFVILGFSDKEIQQYTTQDEELENGNQMNYAIQMNNVYMEEK